MNFEKCTIDRIEANGRTETAYVVFRSDLVAADTLHTKEGAIRVYIDVDAMDIPIALELTGGLSGEKHDRKADSWESREQYVAWLFGLAVRIVRDIRASESRMTEIQSAFESDELVPA